MLCGLIVATVIDFELCIIPDGCTVPPMIVAVLFSFAAGQVWIVPLWFQDMSTANAIRRVLPESLRWILFEWDAVSFATVHPHWHGLLVSLAGLLAGAGITWLVRAVGFWTLKQEAMGDGDVVLMALIGSVTGWQPVLVVFMMAIVLGVIPGLVMSWLRRDSHGPVHFPFGPWLSLAALLLLLAWRTIWPNAKPVFDFGMVLFLFGLTGFLGMAVMLRAVYLVKSMSGINELQLDAESDWSSADHLIYYGAERPDEQSGLWPIPQWPGGRSGRGLGYNHEWRNSN
ncbi:MAG: A24 family peptidase [Fuerstiella sp.]|nr:A24 family peptidase [Fuerstiella sp.]